MNYPSRKVASIKSEKNRQRIVVNVSYAEKNYVLPTFQNFKTQLKVCNTNYSCNYSKQRRMVLSYNKKVI